jgi:seryl-tRNA synthetase
MNEVSIENIKNTVRETYNQRDKLESLNIRLQNIEKYIESLKEKQTNEDMLPKIIEDINEIQTTMISKDEMTSFIENLQEQIECSIINKTPRIDERLSVKVAELEQKIEQMYSTKIRSAGDTNPSKIPKLTFKK